MNIVIHRGRSCWRQNALDALVVRPVASPCLLARLRSVVVRSAVEDKGVKIDGSCIGVTVAIAITACRWQCRLGPASFEYA